MNSKGIAVTHRQQWEEICSKQGWDNETKLVHLLGFIDDVGMGKYLIAYAEAAAKEEDAEIKLGVLEEQGYTVTPDSAQEGMFLWMAPTDASEISCSTRAEAIESAWADAVEQVLSIADMSPEFFSSLTLDKQCEIVRENLAFA